VRGCDDHDHPGAHRLHPLPAAAAGVRVAGHLEVAPTGSVRPSRPDRARAHRAGARIRPTMTYSHPMTTRPLTRRRRAALAVAGAITVVLAVILGLTRPWMPPAETPPIAAAEGAFSPAVLTLPVHPRVLVSGDSWADGSAASSPRPGYAYLLAKLIDGETVVDG